MVMLSQHPPAGQVITPEHRQAAAVDLLRASVADFARAEQGRVNAIRTAAKYLSQRRIAEITGWDRGWIRRLLASGE
jgi:hypothetical protein